MIHTFTNTKKLFAFFFMLFCVQLTQEAKAQATFSSLATGNWNNPTTWTLTSGTSATNYPVAGDDVTIQSGHVVEVNVISQAKSVNLTGTGTKLSFSTSTINSVLTLSDGLTLANASSLVMDIGVLTVSAGDVTINNASSITINLGILTVLAGNITINNASSIVVGTGTLTLLAGNVTVNSASNITQNGGIITIIGFVLVNAPTGLSSPTTGNSLINVDSGVFNCAAGLTLTSGLNASRIAELRIGLSSVNIAVALTTTTVNSKITFSNIGILTLAGVVTIPNSASFSAGNGKVLYFGIPGLDQTIAPLTYNRLSISGLGAGLKKITNTVTVTDTLTLLTDTLTITGGGVLNMSNGATIIRTEGFLKDLPTFLGTVNLLYNGATSVTTGKEMPTNITKLQNLVINNVSGVSLSTNITVNAQITLQNGILNTNGFTLNIANAAGGIGTDPAVVVTNGYVQGRINRSIGTSTGTRIFPFGVSLVNGSRIMHIDYTNAPTVGGTLLVQHFESVVPAESGLPLVDGAVTLDSSLPTYWRADATGLSGGNYTLSLTAQDVAGVTDYTTLRIIKRPTLGGAWTLDGNADTNTGSNSQPTVIRNMMSGFSEFSIASRTAMFRTAGNVNFISATNWQISGDGSVWVTAGVAPSALNESITIRSGHTATVTFNTTLDQVTVEIGGVLEVNTLVTLTIQDGTGTDLTIQNGGTLELQGTSTVAGTGSFALDADGTVKIANASGLQAIGLSGTETFSTNANYELDGTALQTLNSPTGFSANNLVINNLFNAKLNDDITITGTLTIALGYLDLNGNDITLNGNLVENRTFNRIVKDLTATDENSQGGGITFSTTITDVTGEIAGTGLYLRGNTGANYPVTITRKHYKGASTGIARIYQITGTPNQPTTMRIYYASDETTDVGSPFTFVLFRWTVTEGWQSANGTNFSNGTNDIINRYTEATGIMAFSHWTIGSNSSPLPITLVSFNASRINTDEVQLTWTTATEINNKGFEVEQSEDGLTYDRIAFIDGRGNSTTIQQYSHTTLQPSSNYFRLKQIDFDGKFSYSPIRFVEGTASKLYFAPNPTTSEVHLQGNTKADDVLNLEVVGTDGQILWQGKGKAAEVENSLNIALRNFKTGLYLFRLQANGKMSMQKMVKQ